MHFSFTFIILFLYVILITIFYFSFVSLPILQQQTAYICPYYISCFYCSLRTLGFGVESPSLQRRGEGGGGSNHTSSSRLSSLHLHSVFLFLISSFTTPFCPPSFIFLFSLSCKSKFLYLDVNFIFLLIPIKKKANSFRKIIFTLFGVLFGSPDIFFSFYLCPLDVLGPRCQPPLLLALLIKENYAFPWLKIGEESV